MKRSFLLLALGVFFQLPVLAAPSDAFTYQGQLKESGAPATGSYDIRFTLHAAASGGEALFGPIAVSAIEVSGGLFQTQLDFGESPFDGDQRWLEIAVRPAGPGGYTTLSPRQLLTATPYALRAKTVDSVSASAIPDGSITAEKLAPGAALSAVNTAESVVETSVNTTYTVSGAVLQNLTLPAAATVGDTVVINGTGSAGWRASGLSDVISIAPRESSRRWSSVASSANGFKLVAGDLGGKLYTSTDSGESWTARDSDRSWISVASSSDGSQLLAAAQGGQLYTSKDSGVTWTARATNRAWISVASSADGSHLVAAVDSGELYTSMDEGVTWTARDSNRAWVSVASSADGSRLVAAVGGGLLYTSADFGVSWTGRETARAWTSVASSAAGNELLAAVGNGQLYRSVDAGLTWAPLAIAGIHAWRSVASSADGGMLIAADAGGQLYSSVDEGVVWTARETARRWSSVASSADGAKFVASVTDGQLHTLSFFELTAQGREGSRATLVFDGSAWVETHDSLAARRDQPNTFSAANTFSEGSAFNGPVTITDTTSDHDLRVSNGTINGNWHLQALRGAAAGFGALNFNGYWNTDAAFFYNTNKALWRFFVDQRNNEDYAALDVFVGSDRRVVWLADPVTGNLGIGRVPGVGFRLDVQGLIRTIGQVNTNSDRRYKQDIQPLTGALDKIGRLQGVSYDWKIDAFPDKSFSRQRQIGFIAQDVQDVLPELVTEDEKGYLSIAYGSAIPVLVEAVKELKEENAELRSRLERMEKAMGLPVSNAGARSAK